MMVHMSSPDGPPPPVLNRLTEVIETLCAQPSISEARARQLRWVGGELRRALNRDGFTYEERHNLAALLRRDGTTRYLEMAAAGLLRRMPTQQPTRAPASSMRIRMDCLGLIADAADVPLELPERPGEPVLRPVVGSHPLALWRAYLKERANQRPNEPGRARSLAISGIIMDTGARLGELSRMTLPDLSQDRTTITVERRPQSGIERIVREVLSLSPSTRAAVLHWLPHRAALITAAEGSTDALWVSLCGNHRPGPGGQIIKRPPGMPLQSRGLSRAYARDISNLNLEMHAERPGWEPLPRNLEQLRRAVADDLEQAWIDRLIREYNKTHRVVEQIHVLSARHRDQLSSSARSHSFASDLEDRTMQSARDTERDTGRAG
jgi:integrase